MRIRTLLGIGAAVVVAVALTDAWADEGAVKLVGEKGKVTALVDADIDALNTLLSPNAGAIKKPQIKQARVLAIVIGLNAEAVGDKAVRNAAGAVVAALADDKLDEAKEAAKAMKTKKAVAGGNVDLVKTGLFDKDPATNDWDRDLAMQLFKTARAGGLGIEGKVKDWSGKPPVGKDLESAAVYAQKAAMIGQVLQKMTPPKDKKLSEAEWKKWASDMTTAAEEAMTAAQKRDGKATMAAFSRVDKACTVCHEKAK
jgi:hypothetical protein